LALAVAGAASGFAEAKEPPSPHATLRRHDGVYSVHITTSRGWCGEHHLKFVISNGRIKPAGDGKLKASGQVIRDGTVNVAFHRPPLVANARGKLSKKAGSGSWSLSGLQCSGSWRARKLG
jgi:hypothetical protein